MLLLCNSTWTQFDHDRFYHEVRRVLRPSGVLAAFGYGNTPSVVWANRVHESAQLTDLIKTTYESLSAYYVPKLKTVDRSYRDLPFPFADKVHMEGITSTNDIMGGELINFVKSWSDFQRCSDQAADAARAIEVDFHKRLHEICGDNADQVPVKLQFHHFLLLGMKRTGDDVA